MQNVRFMLLVALVFAFLQGCTQLGPYRVAADLPPGKDGSLPAQPEYVPQNSVDCDQGKKHCVHIVEYDEFGNASSRAQVEAALSAAKDVGNTGTVIVYAHGWHHSAKKGDSDIANFLATVSSVGNNTGKKTVGIYIAWRGDSINSRNYLFGWSSYAFTFWDRKSVAHAVGSGGGVTELIRSISAIRATSSYRRLLVIGHSFGGAVLFSSVSQLLAEQVMLDAQDEEPVRENNFKPLADLVLLINPAFEAMRLAPLYSLARTHEYTPDKPPRLVVVTSTADLATKKAFPIGRYFGTMFQAYPPGPQKALDRTTIGHYVPFITHQLVAGKCEPDVPSEAGFLATIAATNKFCFPGDQDKSSVILTRCDKADDCKAVAGNHYIERGAVETGHVPERFPITNIRTDKTVVDGHNDIWGPKMQTFTLGLVEAAVRIPME